MLAELIALFLGVSLLLYGIFAGADFGGGIVEFFIRGNSKESQNYRTIITKAIAPVWEANHVWIILAIVILFNAFPIVYSKISVTLHIPLTLMLLGIILRGCAFTFRHYDAVVDRSQNIYSKIFVFSSFVTPLFLGIIAGAITLGRFSTPTTESYYNQFVMPWWNLFSVSVGIFFCGLCTLLASVFLIGESKNPEAQKYFAGKVKVANIFTFLLGGFVFIAAEFSNLSLFRAFINHPWTVLFMSGATVLLIPLWKMISLRNVFAMRFIVCLQMTCILGGWILLQYPNFIGISGMYNEFSISNARAPDATLKQLILALCVGIALLFPSLGYLFYIFKRPSTLKN